MTREPAEPLSNDERSRATRAGDPRPTTWEEDLDPAEAGAWEAADEGAGEDPESSTLPPGAKGSGADQAFDRDLALIARKEPWRLSHLMIAIVVVAIVLWLGINLGMLVVILAPIALIVLAITAGFVAARLRATRQEALLSLLAIAAERGMPLAPAVSAFADQFRARAQRRILGVVASLNVGTSLPEALNEHRTVSRDALLMAQIGHETGLLAPALRLIGASRPSRGGAWSAISTRLAYLLALMLVAESISGFLLFYVVPKFEAIFRDFGVPLPALTISFIRAALVLRRYSPVAIIIFAAQIILLIMLPFSFGGWRNYKLPIFDRLLARRHTALVLRALSVVIEANKPIGLGLSILAQQYPARWFRRRLAKVSTEVHRGADWIDALWRSGVIRRTDAEVLASAASVGNLVWACRELADTAERRQQLRVQVLIQALFPVAVVAMGLAIATLCLAYFIPLVTLIQRLTDE